MKNLNQITDKDLLDMLGLSDRTLKVGVSIDDDLLYLIENGTDKYLQELEKHNQRKQEFIDMFKEYFDELCLFMEKDPKKRVSVNCFTCIKGLDLRDQYGKSKKSK